MLPSATWRRQTVTLAFHSGATGVPLQVVRRHTAPLRHVRGVPLVSHSGGATILCISTRRPLGL